MASIAQTVEWNWEQKFTYVPNTRYSDQGRFLIRWRIHDGLLRTTG